MLLGYYYADGRYGDWYPNQSSYTNLYRVSRSGWLNDPRGETAAAVASIFRPVSEGKRLQIALDMGSPNVGSEGWKPYFRKVLAELARIDAFDLVSAIELRDEPDWTAGQAHERAEAVRDLLAGRLANVPLGLTFDPADVLSGRATEISDELYGYVACEVYLPIGNWDPVNASDEAARLVRRMKRRIPARLAYWLVGQSYDRRSQDGSFQPAKALKAVQHGTYQAGKDARAQAIVWFAYGREGGVVSYPGLVKEHKAISREEGIS